MSPLVVRPRVRGRVSGWVFRRRQRHGVDMQDVYGDTLAQLRQEGLLTVDADGVRLTRHGLMLGNQVFMRFLAEPAAA